MIHIHFGAGNFSLGFVLWLSKQIGLKSVALTRSPKTASASIRNEILRENKSYLLYYIDSPESGSFPHERIEVSDLIHFDKGEDLRRLRTIVARRINEDILITTSVKDQNAVRSVAQAISKITRFAASRHGNRKTYVIACENGFRTSDVKGVFKQERIDMANMIFVEAVVDRICSRSYHNERQHEFVVEAEHHATLVLERVEDAESLYKTLQSTYVTVTNHIDAYRYVKLGVFNAAHILLAGDAQTYEMPLIRTFLQREDLGIENAPTVSERLQHVRDVLKELSIGIAEFYRSTAAFDPEGLAMMHILTDQKNLNAMLDRFVRVDDEVSRILSRLKTPHAQELHTMSDFLRSMMDKIRPSVIGYLDAEGVGPPQVTRSFMKIADLIAERRFVGKTITRH